MNDLSPMIDLDRTRANMQRFGAGAPASAPVAPMSDVAYGGHYLDRDLMPMERVMPQPTTEDFAPTFSSSRAPASHAEPCPEVMPERPHVQAEAQAAFEDLDAQPLMLGSLAQQTQEPPEASATPAPTPAPPIPAPSAAPTPTTGAMMTPAVMRRIVLQGTTAPTGTPAFGRAQANIGGRGLCFGIGRFCQIDGTLGAYLQACQSEDPAAFAKMFTLPDQNLSDALLQTCTADQESARMSPVGGQELWSREWVAAFKAAAAHPAFQDMQFRAAAETRLIPLLDVAARFHLNTERALSIVVDRATQTGVDGARIAMETNLSETNSTRQNIATLSGIAAAGDVPGRTPQLVIESGPADTPLNLTPEME